MSGEWWDEVAFGSAETLDRHHHVNEAQVPVASDIRTCLNQTQLDHCKHSAWKAFLSFDPSWLPRVPEPLYLHIQILDQSAKGRNIWTKFLVPASLLWYFHKDFEVEAVKQCVAPTDPSFIMGYNYPQGHKL